MSTTTNIVARPDGVKKEAYPRLKRRKTDNTLVVWALGTGKEEDTFTGVVVHKDGNTFPVGYFSETFNTTSFEDFNDAVTLFNK